MHERVLLTGGADCGCVDEWHQFRGFFVHQAEEMNLIRVKQPHEIVIFVEILLDSPQALHAESLLVALLLRVGHLVHQGGHQSRQVQVFSLLTRKADPLDRQTNNNKR